MILSISRSKGGKIKAVEPNKERGGEIWTSCGTMLGLLAFGVPLCSEIRLEGDALNLETGTRVGRVV
jgi:hypothetical protein